jgi:hypothetical protein
MAARSLVRFCLAVSLFYAGGIPGRCRLEPLPDNSAPASADACVAGGVTNLRKGPGTSFGQLGQLSPGQSAPVIGKAKSTSGFTWWKLNNGAWAREDGVTTPGNCQDVPQAKP